MLGSTEALCRAGAAKDGAWVLGRGPFALGAGPRRRPVTEGRGLHAPPARRRVWVAAAADDHRVHTDLIRLAGHGSTTHGRSGCRVRTCRGVCSHGGVRRESHRTIFISAAAQGSDDEGEHDQAMRHGRHAALYGRLPDSGGAIIGTTTIVPPKRSNLWVETPVHSVGDNSPRSKVSLTGPQPRRRSRPQGRSRPNPPVPRSVHPRGPRERSDDQHSPTAHRPAPSDDQHSPTAHRPAPSDDQHSPTAL